MALNVTGGALAFDATIDASQFSAKIAEMERQIKGFSNSTIQQANSSSNMFKNIIAGGLALAGTTKAIQFFGDAVQEALDAEQSAERFKNTLEGIGRADAFDRIINKANELADTFKFLDNDDIVEVFNKLITYGKLTEKQMNDLLPVIIDFAAKQRISLAQSSDIIIKAMEGNGRALKNYGVNLTGVKTEGERLAVIMTTLKSKVEGAGQAFQDTSAGGIASAKQQFQDIKEEIGSNLLPALTKLLNFTNRALTGLKFLAGEVRSLFLKIFDKEQFSKESLAKLRSIEGKAASELASKAVDNPEFEKELRQRLESQRKVYAAQEKLLKLGEGGATQQDINNTAGAIRTLNDAIKALDALKNKSPLGGGGFEKEKTVAIKDNGQLNSLLNDRKSILEAIADIQRQSDQSGLTKEKSILDQINERYDLLIKKVENYNVKANKLKAPTIPTEEINSARTTELANAQFKVEADLYVKSLNDRKKAFQDYEDAISRIGMEASNKQFAEQTKGFTSYLEFLKAEVVKLTPKIFLGIANVGDKEKLIGLSKEIAEATKEQVEKEGEALKQLQEQTQSFARQKTLIEENYTRKFEILHKQRGKISEEEYQDRLSALQQMEQSEYEILKDSINRQSELYNKLTKDITFFSRRQIQNLVKSLQDELTKNGDSLGPVIKKQVEDAIKQLKTLLHETDETTVKTLETAQKFDAVSAALGNLSSNLQGINENLADTIGALASISGGIGQALKSFDLFKAGKAKGGSEGLLDQISGIGGIVGAAVGIISTVVNIFNKIKQKRLEHQRELEAFTLNIFKGEQEITELYRERARQQVKINALRLEGLQDEKKLLEVQKTEIEKQAASIFEAIQKETFKTSAEQLRAAGLSTVQIAQAALNGFVLSLSGKSFKELEELFLKGQLEGKAKDLFEILRKIKAEGVDVDKLLEDNKRQAQETFTGTTADSILDAITQGFVQGKKTIKDFAGTFEDLMRQAAINSLKFKYLEGPVKQFFEDFAAAAESDGQLTDSEIAGLQAAFGGIITNAETRFKELEKITKLGLSTSSDNSLKGAIKGITENQAELLAAQFGGQRVATLTLVEVQKSALNNLSRIELNTAQTAQGVKDLLSRFSSYETGQRRLAVTT